MNKFKRFIFGVLSSLLFAVGFARAAEQFDPMTHSLPTSTAESPLSLTPDTSTDSTL